MQKQIWTALAFLACIGIAQAASRGEPRKQVEMSMTLEGSIELNADGAVSGYTLDRSETIPKDVVKLVQDSVPAWRFEPVTPEARTLDMRLLVIKPLDSRNHGPSIRHASFASWPDDHVPSGRRLIPPELPGRWERGEVSATVFLMLRIGRSGNVEQRAVEQINLHVIGQERDMERLRKQLGDVALRAARTWRFDPPATGKAANAQFWDARVPLVFANGFAEIPRDGRWMTYLPGPRNPIPWQSEEVFSSPDALAPGRIHLLQDQGPRLLTPLQ